MQDHWKSGVRAPLSPSLPCLRDHSLSLPALPAETLAVAQAAAVLSYPGRGGHPSRTRSPACSPTCLSQRALLEEPVLCGPSCAWPTSDTALQKLPTLSRFQGLCPVPAQPGSVSGAPGPSSDWGTLLPAQRVACQGEEPISCSSWCRRAAGVGGRVGSLLRRDRLPFWNGGLGLPVRPRKLTATRAPGSTVCAPGVVSAVSHPCGDCPTSGQPCPGLPETPSLHRGRVPGDVVAGVPAVSPGSGHRARG